MFPGHEVELAQIERRRLHYWPRRPAERERPWVGLALSGGGIRSATFSLGVLTALSRLKLLHRFDYLSTVSGGGYIGSFYCSLFVPQGLRGNARGGDDDYSERAKSLALDPLGSQRGVAGVRQLRESGRYLAPGGTGDALFAAAIVIRNWISIHLVIGITVLALALAADWLISGIDPGTDGVWLLFGWASPLLVLLLPALIVPLAAGWAYWLTKRDFLPHRIFRYVGLWTLGTLIVLFAILWRFMPGGEAAPPDVGVSEALGLDWAGAARNMTLANSGGQLLLAGVGVAAIGALVLHLYAELKVGPSPPGASQAAMVAAEDAVRLRLTHSFAFGLGLIGILAAVAAVDTLALVFARSLTSGGPLVLPSMAVLATAIGAITPLLRTVLPLIKPLTGKGRFARIREPLLLALALSLWGVVGAAWIAAAHLLSWNWVDLDRGLLSPRQGLWLPAFLFALAATVGLAFSHGFLNLSSLATFYAGRLRRAYLGASNDQRMDGAKSVTDPDSCDDIDLRHFYGEESLAPVHLLGVTINETRSRTSNVLQRDRRGRSMVLSPAGYLYAKEDRVGVERIRWDQAAEALPLSVWMGISGAAFSTGTGSETTLAKALLAGFANFRLGYWWRPWRLARSDGKKALSAFLRDRVQFYLTWEFWANYMGTHRRRWYLSDGGHLEMTGVYELMRRRVPFIVCCDNGQDEDYRYDDLSKLIRMARIDFGDSIDFLEKELLDARLGAGSEVRKQFGTLEQLANRQKEKGGPVAALAVIRYVARGGQPAFEGTLMLIKPLFSGDGPRDLLRYSELNAQFPQQSTLDQFFDEAQWESYYQLGQMISDRVFGCRPAGATASRWPLEVPRRRDKR